MTIGIFTTDAYCESHRVLRNSWSIIADSEQAVLTIEYKGLGVVAKNVHLNLRQNNELQLLSNWKVKKSKNKMIINTTEPATNWQLSIRNNVLNVACSSDNAVITAVAPANKDRIPARIADPRGKPEAGKGTNEISYS